MRPFWDHVGTILGPFSEPFCHHFGTIFGPFWDHFGAFSDHFGVGTVFLGRHLLFGYLDPEGRDCAGFWTFCSGSGLLRVDIVYENVCMWRNHLHFYMHVRLCDIQLYIYTMYTSYMYIDM